MKRASLLIVLLTCACRSAQPPTTETPQDFLLDVRNEGGFNSPLSTYSPMPSFVLDAHGELRFRRSSLKPPFGPDSPPLALAQPHFGVTHLEASELDTVLALISDTGVPEVAEFHDSTFGLADAYATVARYVTDDGMHIISVDGLDFYDADDGAEPRVLAFAELVDALRDITLAREDAPDWSASAYQLLILADAYLSAPSDTQPWPFAVDADAWGEPVLAKLRCVALSSTRSAT